MSEKLSSVHSDIDLIVLHADLQNVLPCRIDGDFHTPEFFPASTVHAPIVGGEEDTPVSIKEMQLWYSDAS